MGIYLAGDPWLTFDARMQGIYDYAASEFMAEGNVVAARHCVLMSLSARVFSGLTRRNQPPMDADELQDAILAFGLETVADNARNANNPAMPPRLPRDKEIKVFDLTLESLLDVAHDKPLRRRARVLPARPVRPPMSDEQREDYKDMRARVAANLPRLAGG